MTGHRRVGRWTFMAGFAALGLALGAVVAGGGESPKASKATKKAAPPQSGQLEDALKKARGTGKYALLLKQIKVTEDQEEHGDFREWGFQRIPRYKGHSNLPQGYWVYVYPYWYIWRDLVSTVAPKRAWGPEQATGAPDTTGSGDFGTAWATLTPDEKEEWLLLEYAEPFVPTAVKVYENWNPGAVSKIIAFNLEGKEIEIWNGQDPTSSDDEMGVSEIKVKVNFKTSRLRVVLDSREYKGWNEIDAVGLVDGSGKTHWATAAEGSSTSANANDQQLLRALLITERRVQILEQQIRAMAKVIDEMKKGQEEKKGQKAAGK